jgi:hypothetical protein
VSHPTPLHPDADLAVVLDDLRQNVAAWGDEGMVMRLFRASICLMLLSILDTLIELLADFRAGRLPPVLPAEDESETPAQRATSSRQGRTARHARTPGPYRAHQPRDTQADAPEQNADPAPCRRISRLSPPRPALRRPEPWPYGIAWTPSHVPRPPAAQFRGSRPPSTHVQIITISEHSDVPQFRGFRRMGKRSVTHHPAARPQRPANRRHPKILSTRSRIRIAGSTREKPRSARVHRGSPPSATARIPCRPYLFRAA